MKPILVKNQSEWERLAPVLEALGVTMPQGFNYSEHVPQLPTVIRLRPNAMSWCATDVNDWARPQDETLQTVNEYLQVQEPNDKPLFNMPIYKPTDYKEMEIENKRLKAIEKKYEELLQGVKDAIVEMVAREMHYATIHMQDDIERGMELAYERSAEILTEKTNVL